MIESAEFTFPMWLEIYEEMKSHSKYYHVDPKVIHALVAYLNYKISEGEAAESFAPTLQTTCRRKTPETWRGSAYPVVYSWYPRLPRKNFE